MNNRGKALLSALGSPVGRKVLTGVTGLALVLYVIVHMMGNLSYLSADENAYNLYAQALADFGPLLYVAEIGLAAFIVIHVVIGVSIYLRKRRARQVAYSKYKSAGRPSRLSTSSKTMIFTGIVLLVFLVIHLKSFKFGPGVSEGYVVEIDGRQVRDLKRLMTEKFAEPLYAFGYVGVMVLLGFHMRHGFWSALQSLGLMNPRLTPLVYTLGAILAVAVAAGFIGVPLYIYFSP